MASITKIGILGSSGFIGKNLVNELDTDYDVYQISLRENIWKEKIKDSNIIINLVGKAHDHKGLATEEDFYFANYNLVEEVFDVFLKSDATLLIHLSSIAAVEEIGSLNIFDESSLCNPSSFYGKSKRKAEEFLMAQQLPQNKKIVILRPTMVHGPGDKGNLTILYKIINKGIPYPFSKFNNKRSFLSIDNFNFIIRKIIQNEKDILSGIYNVCDDEAISTSEIIRIIGEITNKKIVTLALPRRLVKVLARIGDKTGFPLDTKRLNKMTSNLIVCNDKIKSALNLDVLPLSAKQGLEKTLKSFMK